MSDLSRKMGKGRLLLGKRRGGKYRRREEDKFRRAEDKIAIRMS